MAGCSCAAGAGSAVGAAGDGAAARWLSKGRFAGLGPGLHCGAGAHVRFAATSAHLGCGGFPSAGVGEGGFHTEEGFRFGLTSDAALITAKPTSC